MKLIRLLGRNIWTFLLAFLLALLVWVSSVTASDPNQEETFTVPLEVIGQEPDLEAVEDLPDTVTVEVLAPQSNLDRLSGEKVIRAWITLEGLEPGTHVVPVTVRIPEHIRPVRILSRNPTQVELTLDRLVEKTMPITREVVGEPAIGYEATDITWDEDTVKITGQSAQVEKVDSVAATLNIESADSSIEKDIPLRPLDSRGEYVSGVTLDPESVRVNQTIRLLGGYRNVAVKVVTAGKVAAGYRATSITPAPPTVMIFSEDPTLVEQLPGYVETETLDLTGVDDYVETILELNLPEGITVVGDPNVLVQVSVTAYKDSLSIVREVEKIGLLPGLQAAAAPEQVEVIIYGPVPLLENLTQRDVRVIVDLQGLGEGVHKITPTVEILSDDLELEAILPNTIEVTITQATTPTPTSPP
jgi:YbbR domain-containing protein